MTNKQFKAAFAIAKDPEVAIDLVNDPAMMVFDGFGLQDFKPVFVTLKAVAGLMRWQANFMFGGWDFVALEEIRAAGRMKFQIM